jgi:hypothetical protein
MAGGPQMAGVADGKSTGPAVYWRNQRNFEQLVNWNGASDTDDAEGTKRFNVSDLDVAALLRTSLRVRIDFSDSSKSLASAELQTRTDAVPD